MPSCLPADAREDTGLPARSHTGLASAWLPCACLQDAVRFKAYSVDKPGKAAAGSGGRKRAGEAPPTQARSAKAAKLKAASPEAAAAPPAAAMAGTACPAPAGGGAAHGAAQQKEQPPAGSSSLRGTQSPAGAKQLSRGGSFLRQEQQPQQEEEEKEGQLGAVQQVGARSPPKQPSDASGGDHTLHLAPAAAVSVHAVQSPYHRPLAAIAIKQEQPSPQHQQMPEGKLPAAAAAAAGAAAAAVAAAAAGADGDLTPARMSFADTPPSQGRQQEPQGQQQGQQEEVQGSAGLSLRQLPGAEALASDADGVYVAMSRLLTLIGNTGAPRCDWQRSLCARL